jgi:hypothetical protein
MSARTCRTFSGISMPWVDADVDADRRAQEERLDQLEVLWSGLTVRA